MWDPIFVANDGLRCRKRQQQQLVDEIKVAEEKIVDNQARINELTCRISELERDLGNKSWTIERKWPPSCPFGF